MSFVAPSSFDSPFSHILTMIKPVQSSLVKMRYWRYGDPAASQRQGLRIWIVGLDLGLNFTVDPILSQSPCKGSFKGVSWAHAKGKPLKS